MKDKLIQAIVDGDDDLSEDISNKIVKDGIAEKELTELFSTASKNVADIAKTGTMIHELLAVIAMQKSFKIFINNMQKKNIEQSNNITVVIGSIFGDYHDLGKNMVSYILNHLGYDVIDLGKSVTCETFVSQAKKHNADIIAVSIALNSSKQYFKKLIELMKNSEIKTKLIIGGPAADKEYAETISAYYCKDPFSALGKIEEILK